VAVAGRNCGKGVSTLMTGVESKECGTRRRSESGKRREGSGQLWMRARNTLSLVFGERVKKLGMGEQRGHSAQNPKQAQVIWMGRAEGKHASL